VISYFILCTAGCFGEELEFEHGILRSEELPCTDLNYYFRAKFLKGKTWSSPYYLNAKLRHEFVIDIGINCKQNCKEKVNPSRKLMVVASCGNCLNLPVNSKIKYEWSTVNSSLNSSALTSPNDSDATMIIAANTLNYNTQYTFLVSGE
jgi:hypothetical protein